MPDGVMPVRDGDQLDWPSLEARLRGELELPTEPMTVEQFTGGRANLTYLVSFGETRVVVRRPPRGTLAPGSHDMAREHKVLSRLNAAYGRAPRSLYFTDDTSVIGAPFIVTEYRTGAVMHFSVADSMIDLPDARRRISLALVDAAADLHSVGVDAVGLTDLGKPDGYAARQLRGWHDRWKRVAPADDDGAVDRIAARLVETMPAPPRVAILHNDLKLDNCQFDPGDPDHVTSVFDWDMATLGDPLFDLGLLIMSMSSANPVWDLTVDEAAARYAERTELDTSGIDWYLAFATWRTAVVMQQLYHRFLAGDSADDRIAELGTTIPLLIERAASLLP